jgi:cyclophilin family peptidyl-prolyl cis-trans isomerase
MLSRVPIRVSNKASRGRWFSLGVLALLLSACGSSAPKSSTLASAGHSSGVGDQSSESSHNRCRAVNNPTPKGNQHIPRPTLKLDPSKRYIANLNTNCGRIEIALDVKQSPKTSASFAYLVQRGFYDELTFHRIVSGFVIQGGDPDGNGSGGPGYTVIEKPPANAQYTRGVVAMAKTETDPPGTSGSQFFIVTGANVELPAQYAILGQVVGGQNTVQAISKVPTKVGAEGQNSTPNTPIVINRATLSVQ